MPRNLDRRVELLVPILDSRCRKRILSIMECYFRDCTNSWMLHEDGRYVRRAPEDGELPFRSQEELFVSACKAISEAEQKRQTVFEPHQRASATD